MNTEINTDNKHTTPRFVGAANAFDPSHSAWICLAEYGEYPHARGLQCFTRQAAEAMVAAFNSLRNRLARKFSGVPIYIGHPDDPQFSGEPGHRDTRAYGWIKEMDVRENGLWVLPKWSRPGQELIEHAFYKHVSPRWAMRQVDGRRYEPIKLISIGLTNLPNIPGDAIANTSTLDQSELSVRERLIQACDLERDANEDELFTAITSLSAKAKRWECEGEALIADNEKLKESSNRFYKIACEKSEALESKEADLDNVKNALQEERSERMESLLASAIRTGLILPNEADIWATRLEDDFESAAISLKEQKPRLRTQSETDGLKLRTAANGASKEAFLEKVRTRMQETGEPYASAWKATKQSHSALFEEMQMHSVR